jgi:hypothetical protein
VPDDASALDIDRERWLAEEAFDGAQPDERGPASGPVLGPAPRRHFDPSADELLPAPDAPLGTSAQRRAARKRRLVLTAGVVLVSMVIVAISGAVGAWIVGPQASPTPAPLASNGPAPGEIGGLLPADAVLQNGESGISAQSLRPAVIALVPSACPSCADLMASLAPQVGSFGVPLVAVGGADQTAQLDQLTDAVGTSRLVTLIDTQQTLRRVYGQAGTTLLLVRADGVVVNVLRGATPGIHLESALVDLVPGVSYGT